MKGHRNRPVYRGLALMALAITAAGLPCPAAFVPPASIQRPTWQDALAAQRARPRIGLDLHTAMDPRDAFIERSVAGIVVRSLGLVESTGEEVPAAQQTCVSGDGVAAFMAPDTPSEYVELIRGTTPSGDGRDPRPKYNITPGWSRTATDGRVEKAPITLTYSFVPDGTTIKALGKYSTEHDDPSNLQSMLNFQFFTADTNVWKNKFRQAFTRWSYQIGVRYVEVGDDGSFMGPGSSEGEIGKRGDIRIGGHWIDGPFGILAYCSYPTTLDGTGGDMVLDTGDYFAQVNDDYQPIRYIVSHEHGHGLGLGHVHPLNHTKLMEPIYNTNFDGPQDDDIRGAQAIYGDMWEDNGTDETATSLGTWQGTIWTNNLSFGSSADSDNYRVDLSGPSRLSVNVWPIGSTYTVGAYDSNDNPLPAQTISTDKVVALSINIVTPDGAVLASDYADAPGVPVSVSDVAIPSAVPYCIIRINPNSPGDVQRYGLTVTRFSSALYVDWKNTGIEDGTAEHPYRTVAAAVNAATPSIDTIFIRAGNYAETLPNGIGKPLTLVNPDPAGIVQILPAPGG